MQTRPTIESNAMARRGRAFVALSLSLALHCGIAYAVMDAASVYGLANVPTPSKSVETEQTVVLEAITPIDNAEPPPESTAQQASVAAHTPSPEQLVPETQVEKTEEPAAAEPVRQAAYQPPPPPETSTAPAEVTPEPPLPAPPTVTVDQPDATEVPTAKPDPQAIIDEQRRQAAERKQKEEEAQRQAALDQREQEQEAKRQAELAQRQREQQREAEKREQERRKVEREAAEKREAEETERKRKSAQQAKEAKKAKGAERDQRALSASRGKAKDATSSARTTASRGDILTYAALVQARVAANRPAASSIGGTVVVTFGVSGSGGLAHSRVRRSSGQFGLDQAALSAVRRASPFPTPPGGQAQTFTISILFN